MVSRSLLKALASAVLDVPVSASESEVNSAQRDKASQWHPDVSDDPNAEAKFVASRYAGRVLNDEINFGHYDEMKAARDRLIEALPEGTVSGIEVEHEPKQEFSSSGGARSDPRGYGPADFVGASKAERSRMMQELALGAEALLIYQSVEGLFSRGFTQEDYFDSINEYIDDKEPSTVSFRDYYEAVEHGLRDEVTRNLFVSSAEKVQENLQQEYGQGTTLREVAGIISYLIANGSMDLGSSARFVWEDPFSRGTGPFGRDDRFGDDPRFSYGSDPFGDSRRRGRGGDPFGRDPRFD